MRNINNIALFFVLSFLCNCSCTDRSNDVVNLNSNNFITLRFEITDELISKSIVQLYKIKTQEVYIYISSYGGSVGAGEVFINALDGLRAKNKTVTCIADLSMSMAFIILQHCDNRYALSNSILMQHQMAFSLNGQAMNVKNYIRMIDDMDESINLYQAQRINMDPKVFKTKTEHDWWLYGSTAVKHNVVDKIVTINCADELFEQVEIHEINTFFGTIKLLYSRCPLGRGPISIDTPRFAAKDSDKDLKTKLIKMTLDELLSKYHLAYLGERV